MFTEDLKPNIILGRPRDILQVETLFLQKGRFQSSLSFAFTACSASITQCTSAI